MGVWMKEAGTLNMTGVNISEVKMGVYAMEAKAVTMERVTISGVQKGITMSGSGTLTVRDRTTITFTSGGTRNYGIGVGNGVTANITGAEITGTGGNGKGTGVYATGAKAVTMEEVRISNVAMGVEAKGGILAMKGGSIGFMGDYGISLSKSTAVLIGVKIEGNNQGQEGIKLNGGMIDLFGTNIRDVHKGMSIENGIVRMFGGEIGFTKDYGVSLNQGGFAFLGGVTIKGSGTGKTGIKLSGGMVDLFKTNIRDVHKGMTITEGIVRMFGGEIGFKKDYGISLKQGGVALKNVRITGPSNKGTGVIMQNGVGVMMMKEVDISKVQTGVWVINGKLMMHKGSVAFNGDYGVSLIGGNALLNGVSITGQDDKGTGVNVEGEGKMTMKDVNISGVITGVWVKNRANAILMGGEIGFKGYYGVYLDKGGAALKNVRMTYTGNNKTADFIKVRGGTVIAEDIIITSTTDNGQGVSVNNGGRVWLTGTNLKGVHKGMTITEGSVRMEGGEINFKGEYGVYLNQGGVALIAVKMTYTGNNNEAEFIRIVGEDTTNAVERVKLKKKGIEVAPKNAVVVASHLTIDGNGYGQGMRVVDGGRVVLIKPNYTNIYNGMAITKGAVHMEGGRSILRESTVFILQDTNTTLPNESFLNRAIYSAKKSITENTLSMLRGVCFLYVLDFVYFSVFISFREFFLFMGLGDGLRSRRFV
ncbi:hypothetical protein BBbe_10200 [Bartonella bovis 91-4]|uniref:Right handed beta helix domain-containing protein n=2 Tax=Bartonella bovis TaxID=155194 RepID=N6VJU4_9HYPH|nr:hypothetical protein BBbe_10200 [Bartonella bovis 91-4]